MAIEIACPECGTRDIRTSQPRTLGERIKGLVGCYQLRCKRCETRFQGALWRPGLIWYARCPRCYRTELSTWSEQYYNPPSWVVFQLRMGATPYRCEYCRCNFASFRACKERYLWRKKPLIRAEKAVEPAHDGDSTLAPQ
jgi:hypothetical protein